MPPPYRFLLAFLTILGISTFLPDAAGAQTFSDASHLFPSVPFSGIGATVVDLDGDGRTDLLAEEQAYLQRDEGFVEIESRLKLILGALVADGNEDGVREVIFLQASRPGISKYMPARMAFTPFEELPIATTNFPLVQGSVLLDDNRDGHLDILLGNDGPPDVLLRGSGDGSYTDMSAAVLPNVDGGTYGMAAADFDRDGDFDIAIGLCFPLPAENLLYRRDGDVYVEVAASAGVADPLASWGVATDGRSTRYANAPRTVERTGVTAIEDEIPTEPTRLHLFPNPSAGTVHLRGLPAGHAQVSVFNLLGQQIHTTALVAGPDGTVSLVLPGLAPGSYFLRTTDPAGIIHTAHFTRTR